MPKPASYIVPKVLPKTISTAKFHTFGKKASFCSLEASSYRNAMNLAAFSKIEQRLARLIKAHDHEPRFVTN